MAYEKEQVKQSRIIVEHLKSNNVNLSNDDKEIIEAAVREAYITGYDDGLNDGKEISEHPISG